MLLSRQLSPYFPDNWKTGLLSTLLVVSIAISSKCEEAPIIAPPTIPAIASADAVQEAFVRVAQKIKPSVVTIYAQKPAAQLGNPNDQAEANPETTPDTPFPFSPRTPDDENTSLGTGMVLNLKGQILTNYHVVKDASVIRVLFDSANNRPERMVATLVGFDEESDLAVLQLAPGSPRHTQLYPVEFADSDATRVGEWAIAMGAPFDQAQTLTVGIISAKGRHLNKDNRTSLQDYLQTDASINPGNSGGPLINLEGKVIGINTAILSPSRYNVGIGFAVPANSIKRYLPLLEKGETVTRGFLGIQYAAIDEEVAREFGVPGGMQIGALARKGEDLIGPAHKAGLEEGDIITKINGAPVISSDEFRRIVAGSTPGTNLKCSRLKPDHPQHLERVISIVLGDWSTQAAETEMNPLPLPPVQVKHSALGMTLKDTAELTVAERQSMGLLAEATGAVILRVDSGTPADYADLRRGLRIVRAKVSGQQWQEISERNDFTTLENSLLPLQRLLLQLRDKNNISLYKVLILPAK